MKGWQRFWIGFLVFSVLIAGNPAPADI
jgi:hypothetical protein